MKWEILFWILIILHAALVVFAYFAGRQSAHFEWRKWIVQPRLGPAPDQRTSRNRRHNQTKTPFYVNRY